MFAIPYFQKEVEHKVIGYGRLKQYVVLINLFIFAMLTAASGNNLLIFRVGLEATTIFTTFLISFNNTQKTREAAWKYVIICSIGLMIGLFGLFLLLYSGIHSLNISEIISSTSAQGAINHNLLALALVFILVGFGTKAALFPMNTWLPDAHGKAPSPVSAFMSAILLPLALYGIYRAKGIVDVVIPGLTSNLLLLFGLITLIFSGIMLLKQAHYKRTLAYSSSEHMGIIVIAMSLNVPILVFAHIVFHSFIKAASFMTAGNILISLTSGHIDKIKKIFRYMKYTPILLVLALIFLLGIPPSYLFVTEIAIIIKAFIVNPWIAIILSVSILLATSGLIINFAKMYQDGSTDHPLKRQDDDFHWNIRHTAIVVSLTFPIVFVIVACVGFGLIG